MIFLADSSGKSNRDGGLNNHDGIGIISNDQLDDRFYRRGIEEVLLAVIVGRGCDNNEVSVFIRCFRIQSRCQIQVLLCQVLFNVLILDWRLFAIDEVNLFRNNIYRHDLMVL